MPVKITLETRVVAALLPHPGNTKIHTDNQVSLIASSIERFGFNDPIGVLPDGTIVEGEGRWRAAQRLGMEDVPVLVLDGLTEREADLYRIAHNKHTLSTGFNLERLTAALREVTASDIEIDMGTLGFDQRAARNVLATFNDGAASVPAQAGPASNGARPIFEIIWLDEGQKSQWSQFMGVAEGRFSGASKAEALIQFIESTGIMENQKERAHERT